MGKKSIAKKKPLNRARFRRASKGTIEKYTNHPSLKFFFSERVQLRELHPGLIVATGSKLKPDFVPRHLTPTELQIFSNADKQLFAVYFDKSKKSFQPLMSCGLDFKEGHIWLHTLRRATEGKLLDTRIIQENFFRVLINPAVNFAKQQGVSEIMLKSRNEALIKKVYSKMNFKFEDPENPLIGVFKF